MNSSAFRRVGRDFACPVCDREDWCLRTLDASAAICQRTPDGSFRRVGDAGWLHRLRENGDWRPSGPRRVVIPAESPTAIRSDLAGLAEDFRRSVRPGCLARLAGDLGVSLDSLARLGIGWCERSRAWSFPMTDASRNVLGIRLRSEMGRKFSVKGGHEGLFIPESLDGAEPLLLAEGPTDTASLLDLGFVAVGRPSCRGARAIVLDLIHRWRPSAVVVVADNDPGGQGAEGALDLARRLSVVHGNVRMIAPPPSSKDVRVWVRSGASRIDLLRTIEAANPQRVEISCRSLDSDWAGEESHVA